VGREDLAVIIYTSGTTGRPKGAMLTHGNLLSNVAASGSSIRVKARDRVIFFIPMFHSFTLTACILMPLSVGAGIIAVTRLRSLPHLVREMVVRRATIFIGIPHVYDVMAQHGLPWWARPLFRLRLCISGSAPLSAATLKAFERRVRIPLLEGYGLSETSPVVSINPLDGIRKPGSVGLPIPGVEVRIVSGDGGSLPPGEKGEIAVRGPNVMRGYLNRPRETKETIRDGWLLTGDIGTLDGEGYLYIVDRKKEMILFHGMNVYPREIEEVLYRHPRVAEAAVVGKPDRHRGEIPVAFVSLREGEGEGDAAPELIAWCRQYLAGYKVPHTIAILDKLPRNAAGKIVKNELKNRLNR
jgi:long-chain acyl-CoA synthetase